METIQDIKETVKEKYGQAALRVVSGQGNACCGGSAASDCADPITSNLYDTQQAGSIPEDALKASLGCGNPTALAQLMAGEVVLDLGSGGGIDVLLSAQRVGPTGKAFGLDMTEEMLALARENQRKSGIETVLDLIGFDDIIDGADLVITGEGRFDDSSLNGKGPGAVAARALALGKPVHVFAGTATVANPPANLVLHSITPGDVPLEHALRQASLYLTRAVRAAF